MILAFGPAADAAARALLGLPPNMTMEYTCCYIAAANATSGKCTASYFACSEHAATCLCITQMPQHTYSGTRLSRHATQNELVSQGRVAAATAGHLTAVVSFINLLDHP
jgi:hypothetical protein